MNSSSSLLPSVEINPHGEVKATVIWLHGLGADGHDFEPIVPELGLPAQSGVRFVFPHAPVRPVTINNGMAMRAWYDIRSMDLINREDEQGLRESAAQVAALIEEEIKRGIPSEKILLAGFSQGGAVALHLGTRFEKPLAGILALSTYLVAPQTLAQEASAANREVPIWMAHGTQDPVVPIARGKAAFEVLQKAGYAVQWQDYPMQHQVVMEEIRAIGEFIQSRLG